MKFVSKLSPEQWAEARRLHADGATFRAIGTRLGVSPSSIANRAGREGWAPVASSTPSPARRNTAASPTTVSIRSRLALRLYRVIECKIKIMELRMLKQLQAHESADAAGTPPPSTSDERASFAALIESINQVTEMVSEPALAPAAAAGRRGAAIGPINPELTALSDDIDPDGLAAASAKDNHRRAVADLLGRMFPKP